VSPSMTQPVHSCAHKTRVPECHLTLHTYKLLLHVQIYEQLSICLS